MKNIIISFMVLTLTAVSFQACDRSETLDPTSVVKDKHVERNELDNWLDLNYRRPYNINFIYRLEDNESDMKYHVTPVDYVKAGRLARIIKHVWFEAYDDVAGKNALDDPKMLKGVHFMRKYSPRVIHMIGSGAYEVGKEVLGTAEGGLKVVLYTSNSVNVNDINELNHRFFHTLHHEFSHILHQTHNYPIDYDQLSAGHYTPTTWYNRKEMKDFAPLGFVTSYAGSQGREDIAEITSCYITYPQSYWDELKIAAGNKGWSLIEKKVEMVKQYMMEFYGIDMDELRDAVARRSSEIGLIKNPVGPILWPTTNAALREAAMAKDCELVFSNPQFGLNNVINLKHSHSTAASQCCH